MKTSCVVLVCLLMSVPARADLRITTRIEARRLASATEPVAMGFGGTIASMLPAGETITVIGAAAVRTEIIRSTGSLLAAGAVLLMRGAYNLVLDPVSRTYYVLPKPATDARVTFEIAHTGDYTTIAGHRAERANATVRMDVGTGVVSSINLPPALAIETEMWIADDLARYAASVPHSVASFAGMPASMALGGFVLRQIASSRQLGYEIETRVTTIAEVPPDPALFEVPPGYREVSVPGVRP